MCKYYQYNDSSEGKIIFFSEDDQAYQMQQIDDATDGFVLIERMDVKLNEVDNESY